MQKAAEKQQRSLLAAIVLPKSRYRKRICAQTTLIRKAILRRGRNRCARQRRELHPRDSGAGICTGDQDHNAKSDKHGAS
ncbi:hypothetical protein [Bradyrhizobium embrapense]|uniref:hypothetical protein n=1 Tax=Bradyrhizobium embrapense TaxID=630921 RepID=UPI00156163CA|nr:hypothetical protein [Bradyrhizobium embrapense]